MKETIARACQGDRQALEDVIGSIQGKIHELSLRMLGHPSDAEDAAQEILIKVVTRMGGFRGESAFSTWVWRIAANHLLTTRRRRAEKIGLSFEVFEEGIARHGAVPKPASPEEQVLIHELRSNCVQAVLICLNRELRLAFVLGEIFGVTGKEGAEILGITPAAFRKRLSRGRRRIRHFMTKNCGLVHGKNPCQCARQLPTDIKRGWIDPENPVYAGPALSVPAAPDFERQLATLDEIGRLALLFETYPPKRPSETFSQALKRLLTEPDRQIAPA